MKAGIKVEGFSELSRDMKRLAKEFPGAIEDVVQKATNELDAVVRQSYRTNVGKETGNLQDGVTSDIKRTAVDRVTGMVKNKAPHAWLVEHGSGMRRHASGKSVGEMPELAPMRKAFDANQGRIYQKAESEFTDEITRRFGGK